MSEPISPVEYLEQCPQCGEPADGFYEGVCEECRDENQSALDLHNSTFDHWESLSDAERDAAIRNAGR